MLEKIVSNYLDSAKGLPFFYVVGDDEYLSALEDLEKAGVRTIHLSDFCSKADKFPSLDDLVDSFRMMDVTYSSNKCVLVGLGEYLALRGESEALKVLRLLKSTTLGIARVIILLRFVQQQMKVIADEDLRLKSQCVCFRGDQQKDVSIININADSTLGLIQDEGIKYLLKQFERGATGRLYVKTCLSLAESMLPVIQIKDAYSVISFISDEFNLPRDLGNNGMWEKLLSDMQKYGNTVESVFRHYELMDDLEVDFIERAFGLEYKNWLYFIALKKHAADIKNPYLKLVVSKTNTFEDFKTDVVNAIIDVKHTDEKFKDLYTARKKLLRGYKDVANFVHENAVDPSESIYKLTDNTMLEKQEIIRWVSTYGFIPEISDIYPALAEYLSKYIFNCGKISEDLTEYFDKYKKQKVLNVIYDDFGSAVSQNALKYAKLETRANAITAIGPKEGCFLYWIDALGVEYMSYIQALAKKNGLAMHVDIVRAVLPTITIINKSFFDEWKDDWKYKQSQLDEIKHKKQGNFDYTKCKEPIHLANELEVIEEAVQTAARELALHKCKKFIIASDHGASRLAVISQVEEKYETDTKGEHSGRCCKYFDGCDIENAIAENGYIILTDYGRFKRSRAANVEAHGGASLEETVIPLITLSLRNSTDVSVKVLDSDNIVVDRKKGIVFNLYISDVEYSDRVSVIMKGKNYLAKCLTHTRYEILNPDIKRSGKYSADVYDGENLIGTVDIAVKGAVGSADSDFDDLF